MNQRDLVGYGPNPPNPHWPNHANIAVSFVVNIEEGSENTPILGDATAENYGGEFPLEKKPPGQRHLGMESLFEYGPRAGFWRLMKLFDTHQIPITAFISGFALTQNPAMVNYFKNCHHELAGHGYRWIDYSNTTKANERVHIIKCRDIIEKYCSQSIQGWYTGRTSEQTRKLLLDIGGFVYDSDSYADDLPYFYEKSSHLIIPYTLDCNDFRFTTSPGFQDPNAFYRYLQDTFDYLYDEGLTEPKLMSIGLHPRISGKPGRCLAIKKFIDYISKQKRVWIARRIDIAKHWINTHPAESSSH